MIALLTMPVGFVFLGCAAWLLRRWGAEPGLQVLFPLFLAGSLFASTSALFDIYLTLNLIATVFLVVASVHIMCIFPQPLAFIRNRQKILWLLYVPSLIPIIYLVLGRNTLTGISAVTIVGLLFVYSLLGTGLLIFKWMFMDWRDFPGLAFG